MPTPTYDLIASNVLTSSASSVTFSSIPATYRDLIIVIDASVGTSASLNCRVNSDTGLNYFWVSAGGNGSTTISQSSGGATTAMNFTERASYASGSAVLHLIYFYDYAQTNKHKFVLVRNNRADAGTSMLSNRWQNTAAITDILLYPNSGSFASGSSFHLYGISA